MLGIILAAGALGLGYLLVDLFQGRSSLDPIDRWAMSFAGLMGWVLLLMVLHMASGGEVFSDPWVVRLATAAIALFALVHKIKKGRGDGDETSHGRAALVAAGSVFLLLVAWGTPALHFSWMPISSDIHAHMGWTEQLLNGSAVPSATVIGDVPNYYPWLYHALSAFLKSFIPHNSAFATLSTIQVLHLAGLGIALFALGRAVLGSLVGGGATVFFGGLMGQLSVPALSASSLFAGPSQGDRSDLFPSLDHLAYHRSLNLPMHNLAPPYPRDIALLLLVVLLLTLFRAWHNHSSRLLLFSGLTLGMIGLAGGEAFFVGAAACALVCFSARQWSWKTVLLKLVAPASGVYALWAVPMIVNYVRLDGFVNITRISPIHFSLLDLIAQWGVVFIPAVVGVVCLVQLARAGRESRFPLIVAVAAGGCLAAAGLLPVVLGSGFASLGRSHRYWPLLYLAASLLGAVAIHEVFKRTRTQRIPPAIASVALVVLATAVGLTASRSATQETFLKEGHVAVLNGLAERDDNLLNALSASDGTCHIAAPESLTREIFSFTGHRLVSWVGKTRGYNSARIRWKGIYERIPDGLERNADNKRLINGRVSYPKWRDLVAKYGVDIIVLPKGNARTDVFSRFEGRLLTWDDDQSFVMIRLSNCAA